MKIKFSILYIVLGIGTLLSCKPIKNKETIVCITSDMGIIKLKLYNETPLHRDNFIRLIKNGYFTNKIFERVIKDFMIQGGSFPDSLNTNSEKDYHYTIPSEINYQFFHKRGALAAARKGDLANPLKQSSPTQFYIVEGERYTREQLNKLQTEINIQLIQSQARMIYFQTLKKLKQLKLPINEQMLIKTSITQAQHENSKNPFIFSDEQRKVYTTIGGTPHLDGTYTVFGEVIEGINVVDKIAHVKTNATDKPIKEIKFTIRILE